MNLFQSTLPRRERRYFRETLCDMIEISIHAPAKGATIKIYFRNGKHFISIHAPAKGATFSGRVPTATHKLFQSTLPRRERLSFLIASFFVILFQSTLPRRERQFSKFLIVVFKAISIHAPAKGATFHRPGPYCRYQISIHAPAKGATDVRRA